MTTFQLVGHDCPLGRYPAPVVPIGRQDDKLFVAYWGGAGSVLEPIDEAARFEAYSAELLDKLGAFDPDKDHLFALSPTEVEKYPQAEEDTFFRRLLAREDFSGDNPFLRLTMAESTKDAALILSEMRRCLGALPVGTPKLRDTWYEKQRAELKRDFPGLAEAGGLPATWQEFAGLTKDNIYDIQTFVSEAPEKPELVRSLFCAREAELSRALDVLRANLDVGGRRAATSDKRPWVIHGDSRSGKSHLARRVMLELPRDDQHVQVKLVLRQKQDATVAMEMLLDALEEAAGSPPVSRTRVRSAGMMGRAAAQVIRGMMENQGVRHVLALVDDVDLLDDYADREHEGRVQRAALSASLAELVRIPGVDVLLTARSWYTETERACYEVVDLAPMEQDQIMEVYERQLSVFAPLRPCDPVNDEAVRKAAEYAQGLPGLFLTYVHVALQEYRREPGWVGKNTDFFMKSMSADYDKKALRRPDQAKMLEEAIRSGNSSIRIAGTDVFRNLTFDNHYVFGSAWSPTTLDISPLAKEIILSRRAA